MTSITCDMISTTYERTASYQRTKRYYVNPCRPSFYSTPNHTTCLAPTLPPSHPANLVPSWVVAVCSSPTSTWLKFMVNALNKVVVDLMLHEQSDKLPLPDRP